MLTSQTNAYDPWKSGNENPIPVSSERSARDLALTALFELRGKLRVKQTPDGGEMMKSNFAAQPARNITNVPIIHTKTGEVRWINFDVTNPGARNRMLDMLVGTWRFATEAEETAAKEKNAQELEKVRALKDAALEGPVNKALDRMAGILETAVTQKKGK
jgi:hypothetical protein